MTSWTIRCAKSWKSSWAGASRARRFYPAWNVSEQCRTAPQESPDAHVAARLRREVLSEYQSVMSKAVKRGKHRAKRS